MVLFQDLKVAVIMYHQMLMLLGIHLLKMQKKVFQTKVISLIKDSKRESVVRAIKDVLREDTIIQDHTVVGYINGYEKIISLINSTFSLSALLASVFYFAIIEVKIKNVKPQ